MHQLKWLVSCRWVGALMLMTAVFLSNPGQTMAKNYELSFALHIPSKAAPYTNAFLPWAKELEKRTNGQVKIKFYISQTLLKPKDAYDGVMNGIADISWIGLPWTPGRFPLSQVMELPFLCPNSLTGSKVITELYNKFPQMRDEISDVQLMWMFVTEPAEIHTNKPIRTLDDLKGMKIAVQSAYRAVVEGLGAVPVTMSGSDIYQAVEKGVADGTALPWGSYKSRKLYEVTKYHVTPHLGVNTLLTLMNKNTWNKLPKDVQKIITDLNQEMMPEALSQAIMNESAKGIEIITGLNQEIIELPSDELDKWIATGTPTWDKWVEDMEAKGLPGKAVLAEALKLIEENK